MSPHAGFVTTLTPLYVSMGATVSVRPFNVCSTFEQAPRYYTRTGFSIGSSHRCSWCPVRSLRVLLSCVSLALSSFVLLSGSLLSQQAMDRLSSSASTASSIDDYSEHNMWNLLLELLFLEHVNCVVDSYFVDLDLAKFALSCHFALDLLCYREEVFVSTR